MPRKSLGYVELEWVCPSCGTRNPGRLKSCKNCGAPQPENVQFERAVNEQVVTDAAAVAAAAAGADYICPYCGTRNSAVAKICVQCGGDLAAAKRRVAGAVLAANAGPSQVICSNCGAPNQAEYTNCAKCGAPLPGASRPVAAAGTAMGGVPAKKKPWLIIGLIGAALAVCVGAVMLFAVPSATVQATVTDVHWQTSVPLQELRSVRHTDEAGSPPGGAYDISCHTETRQVCEEKVIDQGNGYGEKVQDCRDESQDYCSYTVDEWQTIQTYTLEGHDYSPTYSQPSVAAGQRLGDESADYTVVFNTKNGQKTYSPSSLQEYSQYAVGSSWNLRLNALGGILGVQP